MSHSNPEISLKRVPKLELAGILCVCVVIYFVAAQFELFERFVDFSRTHEEWQPDEFLIVSVFLALSLGVFAYRRWLEARRTNEVLILQNVELQKALGEIKQLKGIIPICAGCKKIRDDSGYWHQVESYVRAHTEAEFSHGLCPDCLIKYYPDDDQTNEADKST